MEGFPKGFAHSMEKAYMDTLIGAVECFVYCDPENGYTLFCLCPE